MLCLFEADQFIVKGFRQSSRKFVYCFFLMMHKKKILNGFKILFILLLLLGISFLAMIQWKSDAVMARVVSLIQTQMQDSLKYDAISLEWVRYFPSAALQ